METLDVNKLPSTPTHPTTPVNVSGRKPPLVVIIIGMAGSGKTTVMKALWRHFTQCRVLKSNEKDGQPTVKKVDPFKTYMINLDPAVLSTPYPVNIDICDTIKYKEVMKQYNLGPNGAIMTSLNLFATKFDQVHDLLAKRAPDLDIILIDTPGQIEVFNWSASGSIILDTLALSYPTVIVFILDTARCQNPITFMSNMMYSCGVMYKSKLPFILAFNKIDVRSATQCVEWMRNYQAFADDVNLEDTYMATLSRSCALAMNEFYEGIHNVSISAATSVGFEDLEIALEKARQEYTEHYLPWLEEQRKAVSERKNSIAQEASERFARDRKNEGVSEDMKNLENHPFRWKISR